MNSIGKKTRYEDLLRKSFSNVFTFLKISLDRTAHIRYESDEKVKKVAEFQGNEGQYVHNFKVLKWFVHILNAQ